jgi:type II secretory pathway component GspD/PulD (secretin)
MRTRLFARVGMVTFAFFSLAGAVEPDNEARSAPAATTQPAGEPTLINIVIVQFLPTSEANTPKNIHRQMSEQTTVDDAIKLLERTGKVEVLNRPSILVKWPQSADITIGERVPKDGDKTKYEEIGLKLSVQGQWLDQVDPQRAYLRMKIDHSYIVDTPPDTAGRIVHKEIEKERTVSEGKTAWFPLPTHKSDKSGRRYLIGFTVHRASGADK